MAEERTYRTAAYLRLSKGDSDVDGAQKAESNSISNQRLIIDHFIEEHPELVLVDTYIDDGYTGTNFKRPDLKRLLYDIDEGRIDCIVCKDLSRWGRERIETGTYISKIFKEKGVRFIAINDHYDSLTAEGSETHLIMPIKALTNDNYSRDISMKIRSSLAIKRERGEFTAAFAPYGYRKDPENVNHLIIDEQAARIVRQIFSMKIDGFSSYAIAQKLNQRGIPSPGEQRRMNGNEKKGRRRAAKAKWYAPEINRILRNEIYTGNMVQGRTEKVSYKVNRVIEKPRDEWDIVEGTHEAVISRTDFEIVQSLLDRDTMQSRPGEIPYLFSGLLYCGDCGCSMCRRKRPLKNGYRVDYVCSSYSNRSRNVMTCTSHKISEPDLETVVKDSINQMIVTMCEYDDLARNLDRMEISQEAAIDRDMEIRKLKEEFEKCSLLKSSLYQDLREGLLSEEQFERYRDQFTERERRLLASIEQEQKMIEQIYKDGIAAGEIVQQFKENPKVQELDRRLLVSLIDRILIYEDDRIDIVYRYADRMKKCEQIIENAN